MTYSHGTEKTQYSHENQFQHTRMVKQFNHTRMIRLKRRQSRMVLDYGFFILAYIILAWPKRKVKVACLYKDLVRDTYNQLNHKSYTRFLVQKFARVKEKTQSVIFTLNQFEHQGTINLFRSQDYTTKHLTESPNLFNFSLIIKNPFAPI